ncbi:MAG: PilZ domain-containing protein [Candidatus Omnitrophica bacterium]|nr:PilZ domain-containing protein [Candidatus Omnitrophota bacterium]
MENIYKGAERRKFVRLDYVSPLACKVCKKETVSKLLEGYTANISQSGLLCNIKDKVKKNDLLWLSFDRDTLNICGDAEKRSLIYQNGVIGKVVRAEQKNDGTYDIGIQFLTREEKNLTYIYPKSYFTEKRQKNAKK